MLWCPDLLDGTNDHYTLVFGTKSGAIDLHRTPQRRADSACQQQIWWASYDDLSLWATAPGWERFALHVLARIYRRITLATLLRRPVLLLDKGRINQAALLQAFSKAATIEEVLQEHSVFETGWASARAHHAQLRCAETHDYLIAVETPRRLLFVGELLQRPHPRGAGPRVRYYVLSQARLGRLMWALRPELEAALMNLATEQTRARIDAVVRCIPVPASPGEAGSP